MTTLDGWSLTITSERGSFLTKTLAPNRYSFVCTRVVAPTNVISVHGQNTEHFIELREESPVRLELSFGFVVRTFAEVLTHTDKKLTFRQFVSISNNSNFALVNIPTLNVSALSEGFRSVDVKVSSSDFTVALDSLAINQTATICCEEFEIEILSSRVLVDLSLGSSQIVSKLKTPKQIFGGEVTFVDASYMPYTRVNFPPITSGVFEAGLCDFPKLMFRIVGDDTDRTLVEIEVDASIKRTLDVRVVGAGLLPYNLEIAGGLKKKFYMTRR